MHLEGNLEDTWVPIDLAASLHGNTKHSRRPLCGRQRDKHYLVVYTSLEVTRKCSVCEACVRPCVADQVSWSVACRYLQSRLNAQ
jgi:uncharacterized CHY-type Zn-finger protein